MSEDSERSKFTRKEKEELLARLMEKQISNVAWKTAKKYSGQDKPYNLEDVKADLIEEAWIAINHPDLDKERNPEGFVMNSVRWKADTLGKEFCDEIHSQKAVQQIAKEYYDPEYPQEDETPKNYKNTDICDRMRAAKTKKDAVQVCIDTGFHTVAKIRTVFRRCEMDVEGIGEIVASFFEKKTGRKPSAYSVTRDLVSRGILDLDDIRRELDRKGLRYKPSIVCDYRRKFMKEFGYE